MITIAFDEAGNTGQHLTNADQPLFVLASVNLSRNEVTRLLSLVRQSDSDEAHYVKLKRSAKGKKKLISLLSDPLISQTYVKVAVFNKRFMMMAKVIDLLVEPMAAKNEIDLYSDGANLALSNMHYICMPAFCGEKQTDEFFIRFVHMVRERSTLAIGEFYNHVQLMVRAIDGQDYSKQLGLLSSTQFCVGESLAYCDLAALDPAVPAYVDLVAEWGDQLNTLFATVHDKSKIIAQYREFLLRLSDQRMEPKTLKVGPRTRTFPLKATNLLLEDSKNFDAIQIADIVAGSISHMVRARAEHIPMDSFAIELQALNIAELVVSTVWPSDEIVRHKTNGTEENPADTMAEFIRKQTDLDG